MSPDLVEQKLAELTRRLEKLEAEAAGAKRPRPISKGTWRDAIGMMKDCDLFDEAMRLGAEWRARANAEGR